MTDNATPTAEHFAFLDDLRESGATNMFGAGPYVQRKFGVGREDARAIVTAWMKTFAQAETPKERAALAKAGAP